MLQTTHSYTSSRNHLFATVDAWPSIDSGARAKVLEMMEDEDVRSLPEDIRSILRKYAMALAVSFPMRPETAFAIMGDLQDSEGSIVYSDRALVKQIEFTVSEKGVEAWLRGPGEKLDLANVSLAQVSDLAIFFKRHR
jgi:hypothetical protein